MNMFRAHHKLLTCHAFTKKKKKPWNEVDGFINHSSEAPYRLFQTQGVGLVSGGKRKEGGGGI